MNIPNILSMVRIAMVPVFCVVYFNAGEYSHFWAGGVYGLATLTDFLDGYLARKLNKITRLGRVIDPLADKMMVFAVLVSLVVSRGDLIPWWAATVYFVKEILMGIGALVLFKQIKDVVGSEFLGKLSTVFFFVVCILIMFLQDIIPPLVATIMIGAAIALTLAAFCHYVIMFVKTTKKPA